MKTIQNSAWILLLYVLIWLPVVYVGADGGYVTKPESIAISADQQAILIKNGNHISLTLSTGYTGDGDEFGWIIPVPVPPAIENVSEAGENGQAAFDILGKHTAPEVFKTPACFPAGTEVLTDIGPRSIETIGPGATVQSYDLKAREWVRKRVLKRHTHRYSGDMITILLGTTTIRATGNHPFYVPRGEQLASRPLPRDVPEAEQRTTGAGRWVQARDLTEGDLLLDRAGEEVMITAVSTRYENTEVYNLEVEGCHNYAVHHKGILVHNKAAAEEPALSQRPVTVYGMSTLEHYEVSVLGGESGAALLRWLRQHGYQVDPKSQRVLDSYTDRRWAFVAAKLNPGEKRHYENEFLTPLTIQYQHDELVFPLRISSVSTTKTPKITLYVLAESTVSSSNFPTLPLSYEESLSKPVEPEEYIESCIRTTLKDGRRALVRFWSGAISSETLGRAVGSLMKEPFTEGTTMYLTRLEARMDAAEMSEDIRLLLEAKPVEFRVEVQSNVGLPSSSYGRVAVDADGSAYAAGGIYGAATYDLGEGVTATGRYSTSTTPVLAKYDASGRAQWSKTAVWGSPAVDLKGNIYAAGSFGGAGTYDFGGGVTIKITGYSSDNKYPMLVKCDSSGKPLWAQTVTSGRRCGFDSVAVDSGGNAYAAGTMTGTGTYDFGSGTRITGVSRIGNLVLVKYDPSGTVQWARTLAGTTASSPYSEYSSVAVDRWSNAYAVGEIDGPGTFDFGSGVSAKDRNSSYASPVLVKYDSSGKPLWARTVTSGKFCRFGSVAVDAEGNAHAAGVFYGGTYDFGDGVEVTCGWSGLLVKYDPSGKTQWARSASAVGTFSSVAVDTEGDVYAAGEFSGTATIDFGGGVTITGSSKANQPLLVKYNSSGKAQWARTATTSGESAFRSVAVDSRGDVYAVGEIGRPAIYDFGGGVKITGRYGSAILLKYNDSGDAQWVRTVRIGPN